ncbi:MAG: tRNA-dihydrouridine(20/20a) synthase [Micavibrio sp.]|nr:MAG: tRNA-dihydrouridine(20/20a) synthase [Micavibrio sp.]
MVTTGALIHGDKDRFLRFDDSEQPVALQLGGSDAKDLATCAKMGEDHGYDEINLNCGCPSDRVQSGAFGACLMKEPDHVATCIEAMTETVDIPVTVKCRIGIDEQDSFEFLDHFVSQVADKGCDTFIIHARKAWLKGLSPKENRQVPELSYTRVEEIKLKHPDLNIIVNGGLKTIEDIRTQLSTLDGVMIGREAYQNPYFLNEVEKEIFGNKATLSREEIAEAMTPYITEQMEHYNVPLKSITRHMIGLFHGQPGGRAWRQALSTLPYEPGAKADIILQALETRQSRIKQAA